MFLQYHIGVIIGSSHVKRQDNSQIISQTKRKVNSFLNVLCTLVLQLELKRYRLIKRSGILFRFIMRPSL
jgi:hypothetical protein